MKIKIFVFSIAYGKICRFYGCILGSITNFVAHNE